MVTNYEFEYKIVNTFPQKSNNQTKWKRRSNCGNSDNGLEL